MNVGGRESCMESVVAELL